MSMDLFNKSLIAHSCKVSRVFDLMDTFLSLVELYSRFCKLKTFIEELEGCPQDLIMPYNSHTRHI